MSNNLNNNLPENDSLTGLISNENFSHLNSELQNAIITSMNDNKRKEGGWLGRFLGIKPVNVAMHIGFLICAILMLVVIIDSHLVGYDDIISVWVRSDST